MHRMYENEDITIFWDSDKCGHAKKCVGGSPTVFDITKKPWINIDGAPNAEIWQTIGECPSGALSCVYNHGIRVEFDEEGARSVAFDSNKQVGECDCRTEGDNWIIVHTEVDPEYSGKGIAKRLVFKLAEEAERRKKNVIPVCSYAVKVLS